MISYPNEKQFKCVVQRSSIYCVRLPQLFLRHPNGMPRPLISKA